MIKIDLKRELKEFYSSPTGKITIVDLPAFNFVMIDGTGDPNKSPEYQDAIEALYAISYTLKFMVKKEQLIDYGVMPLEGQWWTDDMARFSISNKDNWNWTSLIMQPEYISEDLYKRALEQVAQKKKLPSLSKARWENFREGLAAQIMYVGPFANEGPVVKQLHHFIAEKGYVANGRVQKHHEIYLSDFRKTSPEKLRTIIRQPMVKK